MREKTQRNRRHKEQPPQKPRVVTTVAKAIGVPETAISALPQIELSGNREAIVEGCQGILEYDENIVRLSLGKMMLRICGRNLQLTCMTAESVIVEGYIMSMEFMT